MSQAPDTAPAHVHVEVARWTHLWMCAAARTYEHLEAIRDDENPVSAIGARDTLSLVVIDAVRNTYRGAAAALGGKSRAVQTFERDQPDLKVVRDRIEHFEDYLRGTGHAQKSNGERLQLGDDVGLEIRASSGGGRGGHTIEVGVREHSGERLFRIEAGAAVTASRVLAAAVLEQAGLFDERHAAHCAYCIPSDA